MEVHRMRILSNMSHENLMRVLSNSHLNLGNESLEYQ